MPQIEPLSRKHRTIIFILSVLLFLVTVPLFVFYAVGYRFDLSGDVQNVRTVGGMYISSDSNLALIYVDEKAVEDMRLFQQAAYIQNLDVGTHRVHTQGDGIQTWVKELPVYSHLVTQARSFNLPASSTVRFVAPYVSVNGNAVYKVSKEDERAFTNATSALPVRFVASPAKVGEVNPEFVFLETLFASTTEDREILAAHEARAAEKFSFDLQPLLPPTTASTTRLDGDHMMRKQGEEVYVSWKGRTEDLPYYFCVFANNYASTSIEYGQHVADQLFVSGNKKGEYDLASTTIAQNNQLCRTEIKIDRKQQAVIWYEFMPDDPNLVLLQLQDGIYVVEVDDRSWQNVQKLYAGDNLTMVVDGGQIFVRDGDIYFELLTEPIIN